MLQLQLLMDLMQVRWSIASPQAGGQGTAFAKQVVYRACWLGSCWWDCDCLSMHPACWHLKGNSYTLQLLVGSRQLWLMT